MAVRKCQCQVGDMAHPARSRLRGLARGNNQCRQESKAFFFEKKNQKTFIH